MAQPDLTNIDPTQTNGDELASTLNLWKEGIHRRRSRGTLETDRSIQTGMLWIDDSTGIWKVNCL